jgi:hypothetical protein
VLKTLQVQTFQNGNAPYLGDPEKDFSYLNFGPENSRPPPSPLKADAHK